MLTWQWFIGKPKSLTTSLLWALAITLSVCTVLIYYIIRPVPTSQIYRSNAYQLSAAVNAQVCHSQYAMDPKIVSYFRKRTIDTNVPIFNLSTFQGLSLVSFCTKEIKDSHTVGYTVKNLEVGEGITLFWLDRAIIYAFGNITYLQFQIIYRLAQIACFGIFCWYLLCIGCRWFNAWVITFFAVATNINHLVYPLNGSAFSLPCLLLVVALYGFSLHFQLYRHWIKHLLLLFLIVAVSVWWFYTRSSTLPSLLALLAIYLVFLLRSGKNFLAIVMVLGSFALFTPAIHYVMTFGKNTTVLVRTHPFMHPIVLSLSAPANDLAKKEGIKWDDYTGLKLAKRINPKVEVLYSPEYNAALTQYYKKLWQTHRQEMLMLYQHKFSFITQNTIHSIISKIEPQFGKIAPKIWFWPWRFFVGLTLHIVMAAGALYFLLKKPNTCRDRIFVFLAVLSLALLNLLESSIIMSSFYLSFQTVLVFFMLTSTYLFWGQLASLLVWLVLPFLRKKIGND